MATVLPQCEHCSHKLHSAFATGEKHARDPHSGAAALRGDAGPALLDSYPAERRQSPRSPRQRADHLHLQIGAAYDPDAGRGADDFTPARCRALHLGYRYDSDAVIDPQPDLPSHEDVARTLDGAPAPASRTCGSSGTAVGSPRSTWSGPGSPC
ncbi:hypothetical protein [Streptomyces lydicus]|uniref:hypothetical protein n=1 Tax=Streptomyces lydicus TaxID=47763 RepID=UPI0036E3E186